MAISDGLAALCIELKRLIHANEQAPVDEQLAIELFDLDPEGSARKCARADGKRAADRAGIEGECRRLAVLAAAITGHTWDRMAVKGRNLRGIFTRQKVENYAMLHADATELLRVQRCRTVEQRCAAADSIRLCKPVDCKSHSLTGSSSHRYIEPEPLRYQQLEVVTFFQMAVETVLSR